MKGGSGVRRTRRSRRALEEPRLLAGSLLLAGLSLFAGCGSPRILAPPPPLRAASANDFAVVVEFAEPLDRATAEDPSRYAVYPLGAPGAPVAIFSATLIDTLTGRVVQLLLSGGPLPDTTLYSVEARGVVSLNGRSLGRLTTDFPTGLSYAAPLRDLFARRCDACHGPARVEGSYRTDSYTALFAAGTNTIPNLIASDPKCLIVVKTKPGNSMYRSGNLSFLESEMIRNWVVSYAARP